MRGILKQTALFLFLSLFLTACFHEEEPKIPTPNGGGSAIPSAPSGVNASAGNQQVTISWSAVSGATSYNIYWATAPGVTKSSTKITGVASPSTHGGLANGTTYYYVVTAVNSGGTESAVSSEVFATPTLAPPPPP